MSRLHKSGNSVVFSAGPAAYREIQADGFVADRFGTLAGASGGAKWLVSTRGGTQPQWSPDGSELFYVENDTLIAVPVETTHGFSIGESRVLFSHPNLVSIYMPPTYDVAADAQRFIMVDRIKDPKFTIQVVQNWYEEFRGREHD